MSLLTVLLGTDVVTLRRENDDLHRRIAAVMEGQQALKDQTVRIRLAALGGERDPGPVDTEKLVADLRANYDRLVELTEE
jgi:hypothetical protein